MLYLLFTEEQYHCISQASRGTKMCGPIRPLNFGSSEDMRADT